MALGYESIPGRRKCLQCDKTFLSQDVERIRRCPRCKKNEDGYPWHAAKIADITSAVRQHKRKNE